MLTYVMVTTNATDSTHETNTQFFIDAPQPLALNKFKNVSHVHGVTQSQV